MRVQIRRGVFETNSSSIHSICIAQDATKNEYLETLRIQKGEFGWEFDTHDTPESRASYLYTAMDYYFHTDAERERFRRYITGALGTVGVKVIFEEDPGFSYIDHGSETKEFFERVLNDPEQLLNFIFNPQSVIYTGNDNSDEDIPDPENPENYEIFTKGN